MQYTNDGGRRKNFNMSTFGTFYKVSTFGESHCKAVGVIVDGCPPGLSIDETDIQPQLSRRRPGQSDLTTPVITFKHRETKRTECQSYQVQKWVFR